MDGFLSMGNGEKVPIKNNSLLVFIDETGDELISDTQYPIFGYGGIAIPILNYENNAFNPWNYIKDEYFEGRNNPLHATDLRKPTKKQIETLNRFFTTFQFGRFATIISDRTVVNVDNHVLNIMAASLYKRLEKIVSNTVVTDIVMIFESCERTDLLVADYFSRYKFIETINDKKLEIPVSRYKMDKTCCEPGLEIADFIIHTAGTSIRDVITGKISQPKERKDFNNIFGKIDDRLSDFLNITSIKKR